MQRNIATHPIFQIVPHQAAFAAKILSSRQPRFLSNRFTALEAPSGPGFGSWQRLALRSPSSLLLLSRWLLAVARMSQAGPSVSVSTPSSPSTAQCCELSSSSSCLRLLAKGNGPGLHGLVDFDTWMILIAQAEALGEVSSCCLWRTKREYLVSEMAHHVGPMTECEGTNSRS